MGILSDAAMAPIKRALEIALPDRCTIKRVTSADNGHGGWTESETDFVIDLPCRVDKDQRVERELIVAGRPGAESSFVISLSMVATRWPGGTVDVQATDKLTVTGEGAGTYEPIGDGGPVSDEFLREVRVTKTE